MSTDRRLSSGFSVSRLERVGPAMQRYVDAGDVAGTIAVIGRHGNIVYQGCCGLMDIASGRPMRGRAETRDGG